MDLCHSLTNGSLGLLKSDKSPNTFSYSGPNLGLTISISDSERRDSLTFNISCEKKLQLTKDKKLDSNSAKRFSEWHAAENVQACNFDSSSHQKISSLTRKIWCRHYMTSVAPFGKCSNQQKPNIPYNL